LHYGVVSVDQFPKLDQEVTRLVDLATNRRQGTTELDSRHKHFSKATQRAYAAGKDLAELATAYKGFEQSSEAADVILGEKLKLKNKSACDFAKQALNDSTERDIFTSLMQLAQAIGQGNVSQGNASMEQGINKLAPMIGKEEAEKTRQTLTEWCSTIKVDPSVYDRQPLSILDIDKQSKSLIDSAMSHDPVVADIKKRLHKFNGRSRIARATGKFLNTSLSLAGYTPTIISPAAQVAWGVYLCTQGGPEEAKLLKEVYLSKRFESRWTTLNDRAKLALNSYNYALITKNPALLSVSDYVMNEMSAPATNADANQKEPASGLRNSGTDTTSNVTATETTSTQTEVPAGRQSILTNSGLPD